MTWPIVELDSAEALLEEVKVVEVEEVSQGKRAAKPNETESNSSESESANGSPDDSEANTNNNNTAETQKKVPISLMLMNEFINKRRSGRSFPITFPSGSRCGGRV